MSDADATLPAPLVPPEADLRDFPFTPIVRARLFGSTFHARVSDAEWRAGVTLWLKSWDQTPAGSLPSDDVELARLAEFARDVKAWRKVKAGALHGWRECADGRLYHPVVAEYVLEAFLKRRKASDKGKAGAAKRWHSGNGTGIDSDSTGMPRPMAQAMPGDSNRQGQGQGEREVNPPTPLGGGLPALSRQRSPERIRRDRSRGAWIQSEIARKANDFESLRSKDRLAAEALRLIGGFTAIGMSNTDRIPQLRARFRETYEQLLEREATPA